MISKVSNYIRKYSDTKRGLVMFDMISSQTASSTQLQTTNDDGARGCEPRRNQMELPDGLLVYLIEFLRVRDITVLSQVIAIHTVTM